MDFVTLKELVRIVTPAKMRNIEILGYASEKDTPLAALYECIAKGKARSDEEAAEMVLGAKASRKKYNTLRNRLVRQLIHSAFLIDPSHVWQTDRVEAYHHCLLNLAAASIPTVRDTSLVVISLLEKVMHWAVKYEFPYIGADAARFLRLEYGRTRSDPAKHEYYAAMHRKMENARQWDIKSWDYHESLIHYYISRSIPDKEIYRRAGEYFEELFPHLAEVDTGEYYHRTYEIAMIRHFAVNECARVIELCDEILSIIRQRPNTNRAVVTSILLQKMLGIIQLAHFDAVRDKAIIAEAMQYVETGTYNWFKVLELEFIYHLHTREYETAFRVFREAWSHPRFALLQGKTHAMWEVYGGYLHLLATFGKLRQETVQAAIGVFKHARFLNNIFVIPAEKEGMNIPIVFLPILFGLKTGTLTENGFSQEAFIKYKRRYLDTELNTRSSAFANLLLALCSHVYRSSKTPRIIERELDVLHRNKSAVSRQTTVVEIIPYEHLWEMLIAP